jgi:hypothetical protein
MSITPTTIFYGSGNYAVSTQAQGGVYQTIGYTAPLSWHGAYSAPTPTGEAILAPTVALALPHTLFTGESSGFWIHRVFLDGHLVGTFTFTDQQFSIPMQWDTVQSVAMPFTGTPELECGRRGCDTPSPSGAAVLLMAAVFARSRNRKA